MGNCVSGKEQWIAKETFHPADDLKVLDDQQLLKFDKDDKLKMVDLTKFIDNDMYLMKNLNSKEVGLVSKIFVAKCGTLECEP
jgi:hypothetical protein